MVMRKIPLEPEYSDLLVQAIHNAPKTAAEVTWKMDIPSGLPKGWHLMKLDDKFFGNTIFDAEGNFIGQAHLYPVDNSSLITSPAECINLIWSIAAIATGQHYLSSINSQISLVNDKLDDILHFLYGENKAELLAEIAFIKRAHNNFASIMQHDEQRRAVITNLQSAQRIGIKDLEFYLSDLESAANKGYPNFASLCENEEHAWRALNCADMALQVCVMGALLEIFFSKNMDKDYANYIEQDMSTYIKRHDNAILSAMTRLDDQIKGYVAKPFENVEARQKYRSWIKKALAPYHSGSDSPLKISLDNVLDSVQKDRYYYISPEGELFYPD